MVTASAHPRSRGENLHLVTVDEAWAGSSPLARGKLRIYVTAEQSERLIPARAGKTGREGIDSAGPQAHPRVSGENPPLWLAVSFHRGSSPRERGKHQLTNWLIRPCRLIPA